jgi:sulfide:quinone oxidoreductase
LTYVTAEPFLGHFGIGGLPHGEALLGVFLKKEHIDARIGVAIDHVATDLSRDVRCRGVPSA